jgi:pimeloyl-ACP methyl ester carboxylesterase
MKLNFIEVGFGKPMVILHGLFGSLDNWMTIARRFAKNHQVFLVDQRNHGKSGHADDHTYAAMSEDLLQFFEDRDLSNAVLVGHSMGGKTAMQFAIDYTDKLDRVVVVDIGPQGYEVHHDHIIRSMQSLDLDKITSRKEAEEELANMIELNTTRQFLLKNLYRTNSEDGSAKYAWRFNLKAIANEIEEVGLPMQGSCDLPMLFVRGERSNYLKVEQLEDIRKQFPNADLLSLNAGHWVHAEDPEGLYEAITNFSK